MLSVYVRFSFHSIGVCNLKPMLILCKVTANLFAALKALRETTEPTTWWIDALCINQDNIEERRLQVLRMTSIYRSAVRVVAWIGVERPGEPSLQELLSSIKNLLQSNEPSPISIAYFRDLLSRKYWRRVWIIQEIAMATEIRVVCGRSSVDWVTLCKVFDLYQESEIARNNISAAEKPKRVSKSRQYTAALQAIASGHPVSQLEDPRTTVESQSVVIGDEDGLLQSYAGF